MIKVWPLPPQISENIKMLDASIKRLEKYSISDNDVNLSTESSFSLEINSFLNISKKMDITNGFNTIECAQYDFHKKFKSDVILSKNIFLIRAANELSLPDNFQQIRTLVKADIEKSGAMSLFPIFYTLANAENIDDFLPKEGVFRNKLLEYKNKINNVSKNNFEINELEEYFNNLKFDSDNFVGNSFITILKGDNDDFVKSKISVKTGENDYFVVSNILCGAPIKEKVDFVKPTFILSILLSDKLQESIDCFIDTFCNDFLINSL